MPTWNGTLYHIFTDGVVFLTFPLSTHHTAHMGGTAAHMLRYLRKGTSERNTPLPPLPPGPGQATLTRESTKSGLTCDRCPACTQQGGSTSQRSI